MTLPPIHMYFSMQAPWATSNLTHLDGDPCRRALLIQPCAWREGAD